MAMIGVRGMSHQYRQAKLKNVNSLLSSLSIIGGEQKIYTNKFMFFLFKLVIQ